MTSLDQLRVHEHQQTLDALAAERKALQARRASWRPPRGRRARARAARRPRGRGAQRAGRVDRRAPRPQRAARRRAADGAAAAAGLGRPAAGRRSRRRPSALPIRPFQGALPWPARGTVSRRFGRQPSSRFGTAIVRNGMEMATAEGQPVRAVHEGTVAFADPFAGYGNLVIVDHGDRAYSLYGHLGSVEVGDRPARRGADAARDRGPEPGRNAGALLRAARRRGRRRSLTMAEATSPDSRVRVANNDFKNPTLHPARLDAGPRLRDRRRPDGQGIQSGDQDFQHLRVFEDVVSLVMTNYVEDVKVDKVMEGAMRGLADGLDPDCAYLNPKQARADRAGETLPDGDVGLELTRQYYLRVIAARDGSPAAKAGLQTGDYVRAIDGKPTRDMSVFEGTRLLAGPPGSKVTLTVIRGNAAEPHDVVLVREKSAAPAVTSTHDRHRRRLPARRVVPRRSARGPEEAGGRSRQGRREVAAHRHPAHRRRADRERSRRGARVREDRHARHQGGPRRRRSRARDDRRARR